MVNGTSYTCQEAVQKLGKKYSNEALKRLTELKEQGLISQEQLDDYMERYSYYDIY